MGGHDVGTLNPRLIFTKQHEEVRVIIQYLLKRKRSRRGELVAQANPVSSRTQLLQGHGAAKSSLPSGALPMWWDPGITVTSLFVPLLVLWPVVNPIWFAQRQSCPSNALARGWSMMQPHINSRNVLGEEEIISFKSYGIQGRISSHCLSLRECSP